MTRPFYPTNLSVADCQKSALFTDEIESQAPRSEAVCVFTQGESGIVNKLKTHGCLQTSKFLAGQIKDCWQRVALWEESQYSIYSTQTITGLHVKSSDVDQIILFKSVM